MRYLPLLLLAMFFFIADNPAKAQKKLYIIGSSTSACFGPSVAESCYVSRLQRYYYQAEPQDTIVNRDFAVGGFNVYQGMPSSYVPPYSAPNRQPNTGHNISAAIAVHPDVILVNYPTNDYDVLPLDSIMYCLRTIRDSAVKENIPCFVTTTQPRTSPGFNTAAVKLKLAILKDSILAEFGAFAIDFYTDLINPADSSIRYDAGDQTHMNDIGHDSLAQRVIRKSVFLATLPATFLSFNTVNRDGKNIVSWLTAQESNIAYYEVQRSADGTGFSKTGSVMANNSAGQNRYQYIDEQPLAGNNYYKIIIVDKDGKTHVSPVMKVYINTGQLAILKSFANASAQVVVQLNTKDAQNAEFEIINNMGMVLSKEKRKIAVGSSTVYISTPLLASGVYHVRVLTSGSAVVSSFIKN